MDEKEPAINTKDYRESKEKNKAIIVEVKKLIMVKEQFLKENIGVSLFCHGGEIWQGNYGDISQGVVINEQPPSSGNYTLESGGVVLARRKNNLF